MNTLFDQEFMTKLEYLRIVARRIFSGKISAHHRSTRLGWGIDFADYREYTPGDDFRLIDWNLYGRIDKYFTKLFHVEMELDLYIFLDVSLSMTRGEPSKLDYAKKVTAALAYIGLANLNHVSIVPFSNVIHQPMFNIHGKGQILKVFQYLSALEAHEYTNMQRAFRGFVRRIQKRGIAIIISDFYDPQGFVPGLKLLGRNRFEMNAIQVNAPEEARLPFRGHYQLVDVETGDAMRVSVTERMANKYAQAFDAFRDEVKAECIHLESNYFDALTTVPFDDLILTVFRKGNLLQ